ncbi:MAG: hypothetical protein K2L16_04400, partial [Muribaculaceae bacterium]|nr:hypothetical protein [Muribaculaceae bacterium]
LVTGALPDYGCKVRCFFCSGQIFAGLFSVGTPFFFRGDFVALRIVFEIKSLRLMLVVLAKNRYLCCQLIIKK